MIFLNIFQAPKMATTVWRVRTSSIVKVSIGRKHAQDSEGRKISNIGCRISYIWGTISDVDFEVLVHLCRKCGFIISRNILSQERPSLVTRKATRPLNNVAHVAARTLQVVCIQEDMSFGHDNGLSQREVVVTEGSEGKTEERRSK
jgi:hypothetical protein